MTDSSFSLNIDNRVPALIPTHNASALLVHNFKIMKNVGADKLIYPIVVDDRSTEDIRGLCSNYDFGYIRIDHDFDFNYSINMNTAAKILYDRSVRTAIFLNNDCYVYDKEKLKNFIDKHRAYRSNLSAPKLIYPPSPYSFKRHQPDENKIQFGGGYFINNDVGLPAHNGRFLDRSDIRFNVDREDTWVTGAFNIIDLDSFFECGGYDENLTCSYQDVLLSIQFLIRKKKIFYIGENVDFYHDEATTRAEISLRNEGADRIRYVEILKNILKGNP